MPTLISDRSGIESVPIFGTYPWENLESNPQLEASMAENRALLEQIREMYPIVWHMDFNLNEYYQWIDRLIRNPDPVAFHLTIVCLAVRATTDAAEFEWQNRINYLDIQKQIKSQLIPAVQRAHAYVAGRRCLSDTDESDRLLYVDHIRCNLEILEAMVNPDLILKDERKEQVTRLRETSALV